MSLPVCASEAGKVAMSIAKKAEFPKRIEYCRYLPSWSSTLVSPASNNRKPLSSNLPPSKFSSILLNCRLIDRKRVLQCFPFENRENL
jgi:hypothetical protein